MKIRKAMIIMGFESIKCSLKCEWCGEDESDSFAHYYDKNYEYILCKKCLVETAKSELKLQEMFAS